MREWLKQFLKIGSRLWGYAISMYSLLFWCECGEPFRDSIKTIRFFVFEIWNMKKRKTRKYSIDSYQLCFPFLLAVPLFSFFDIIIGTMRQSVLILFWWQRSNGATKRLFVRPTTHTHTYTHSHSAAIGQNGSRFAWSTASILVQENTATYYRRIETKITFQTTSDETHFENRKLKIKEEYEYTANRNEFVALSSIYLSISVVRLTNLFYFSFSTFT